MMHHQKETLTVALLEGLEQRGKDHTLTGYTEAEGLVNDEKKEGRNGKRPAGNNHNGVDLDAKLNTHGRAIKDSSLGLDARYPSMREESGKEASYHAAHAVHAECVQGIVITKPFLDLEAEIDYGCAHEAHDEGCCLVDVA